MSSAVSNSKEFINNNQPQEITIDEALKLARGHHQSGNFILAERTYRDILSSVSNHFPTTQFLGVLLFQSGNFEDARRYLDIALQTEPKDMACLNNYAGILTQAGEYEDALELYDKALSINGNYLDALNNKAYTLWALGRYNESHEIVKKALEIAPKDITALNNLGMVLAKLIKFAESSDVWEKASKINPDGAMIWSNWGNTLREMGDLKGALEKCQKAVDLAPDHPEALNNLANALRDRGKPEEAIALYRKATNNKPNYPEAHSNMAIAYLDDGYQEKAVVAARYAIAFNKDLAEPYSALSQALSELGEYKEAHMVAQRATYLAPDNAGPFLDLAGILLKLEYFDDSEAAMYEAIKREPESARAYMKLAEIHERMNQYEASHEAIDKAIKMSPDMAALWVRKAMTYFMDGKLEEALINIDKAIKLAPKWPVALQQKAEMMVSLNRNDEALEITRKILSITKKLSGPYSTLASIKTFESEDDPDFINMKAIEENVSAFGLDISAVYYFSMSDVYEQLKKFDLAFEYLEKANTIKKKIIPFNSSEEKKLQKAITVKYTPELIKACKGKGFESDVPVFILGVPRSGTTLTEQIISAHPDVFGAGELSDFGRVQKLFSNKVNEKEIIDLGISYVEAIQKRDPSGNAKRITDKMPANYHFMGIIACALPNAKIIHCRRNPIDTCLSCYKQNFLRGQHWSYSMEEMVEYYKGYLEIMEHWRKVIPDRFIEVDYEETVNNLEDQARRLIEYIGLEWNDACLEPHKQKRAVLTASKAQVTKPVYTTSVEKWKRYEKYLQPLIRELLPEQALPEEALLKEKAKG